MGLKQDHPISLSMSLYFIVVDTTNSHPEKCAAPSPTQNATELCPCEECDETVLNTIADGFSCGERIRFLQTQAGGWFSATESCNFVASEFSACRACGPKFCDATSGTPRRFSEIRWSALLWVAVCVPTLSFWAMWGLLKNNDDSRYTLLWVAVCVPTLSFWAVNVPSFRMILKKKKKKNRPEGTRPGYNEGWKTSNNDDDSHRTLISFVAWWSLFFSQRKGERESWCRRWWCSVSPHDVVVSFIKSSF